MFKLTSKHEAMVSGGCVWDYNLNSAYSII